MVAPRSHRAPVLRPLVLLVAVLLSALSVLAAPASAAVSMAGGIVSVSPARLLDTRESGGAIAPGTTRSLTVVGVGGVPATGVASVLLNVTVTEPNAEGWVTVFPAGEQKPTASTVNFKAGATVPNMTLARLGANGRITIAVDGAGSAQVVIDVMGYVLDGAATAPGAVTSVSPSRLLDTRTLSSGRPTPGSFVDVQVTGSGGVPADADAAIVNITSTHAAGVGWVTAFARGTARPTGSNLNYTADTPVANLAVVPLSPEGQILLYVGDAASHLVVDVVGYIKRGIGVDPGALDPITPTRVVDTRDGTGGFSYPMWSDGGVISFDATDLGAPQSPVAAVVLNVTVTETMGTGYLKAFASGAWRPASSNSNWQPGLTRAAMVVAPVNTDGFVTIFAGGDIEGQTDVVVDITGYVLGDPFTYNGYDHNTMECYIGSGTVAAPAGPYTGPSQPYTETGDDRASKHAFDSINAYRAGQGLAPLKWDERLWIAGGRHNMCMSDALWSSESGDPNEALSHQLPNEPDFVQRIAHEGVTGSAWGENVAYSWDMSDAGIDEMVASMMAEGTGGGHHDAIMSMTYTHVGVYVMIDYWNGILWMTMDFAKE